MSPRLLIVLLIGTAVMLVPIIIQAFWYKIKFWKTIPIGILLTVIGTIGTYLMFFLENGSFKGTSFYGAVFFVPIVFLLVAWLFRIPYGQILDLCAPAECIMLVIMKTQCLMTGCCAGRLLYVDAQGKGVIFPSQIVELIDALILCVVLLFLSNKQKQKGTIYPWYLLLYGISRFILNFFRDVWSTEGIPFGTIWSVVSIIIGTVWLILLYKKHKLNLLKEK